MHSHFGACHHQGIPHIIAGISHICEPDILQIAEMLPYGQQICQHLGGMELICEPVPNRHPRVFCKLLHNILPVSPIFNSLKHACQNPGRIRDALLFSDLGARRVQISGPHTQVMCGHLKCAPGTGTGFFKNQCHIFSPKGVHRNPFLLFILQFCGQINQIFNLLRCKIQQF